MFLLGSNKDIGTTRIFKINSGEIVSSGDTTAFSTLSNYSSNVGFNGQKLQKGSESGEYILVITNVVSYAIIEMMSANCEILTSHFA